MVERLDEIKHGICGEKARTMTVAVLITPPIRKIPNVATKDQLTPLLQSPVIKMIVNHTN